MVVPAASSSVSCRSRAASGWPVTARSPRSDAARFATRNRGAVAAVVTRLADGAAPSHFDEGEAEGRDGSASPSYAPASREDRLLHQPRELHSLRSVTSARAVGIPRSRRHHLGHRPPHPAAAADCVPFPRPREHAAHALPRDHERATGQPRAAPEAVAIGRDRSSHSGAGRRPARSAAACVRQPTQ